LSCLAFYCVALAPFVVWQTPKFASTLCDDAAILSVLHGDMLPLDPISQLPWFDMIVFADVANVPK
jgi:hypothetical protein